MKESKIYKCEICGKEVQLRGFGCHLKSHGMTSKEYWSKFPYPYPPPVGEYGKDYVTCPICNNQRSFQFLWQHLKSVHGMSIEEFLIQYPGVPLMSEKHRELQSKKCRKGLKKNWSSPEYVESRKQYLRDHPNLKPLTPEQRETQIESTRKFLKEKWSDPEYCKMQSEKTKLQHQKGGLTKAILRGYGKKRIPYTCPDGTVVSLKSTYELQVAEFLSKSGIKYQYEKEYTYYDTERNKERKYYADFYLNDYDYVLEVKASWAIERQNNIDKMKGVLTTGTRFMFFTEQEMRYLVSIDKFEELIQSNINE